MTLPVVFTIKIVLCLPYYYLNSNLTLLLLLKNRSNWLKVQAMPVKEAVRARLDDCFYAADILTNWRHGLECWVGYRQPQPTRCISFSFPTDHWAIIKLVL